MPKGQRVKIYIDGGSRGNPGPGAAGVFIQVGKREYKLKSFFPQSTNNQAEYRALILALEWLKERREGIHPARVTIYSDSLLLIKQLGGSFKVRNKGLKVLNRRAQALLKDFAGLKFKHIPRAKNQIADRLVNEILDKKVGS